MGLSQEKLGIALGLTFQQVQKYERGANRIGASRLYHLSQILEVPVAFFFDDMPVTVLSGATGMGEQIQQRFERDPLIKRETLELVRAYYRITNTRVRKRLFEMTKAMAKLASSGDG